MILEDILLICIIILVIAMFYCLFKEQDHEKDAQKQ